MRPPLNKKASYSLEQHSIRSEILKSLHDRRMLIFICSLVVLESLIVTAEVMVDLHGIRARFENEEKQIQNFVEFVQTKHPDLYSKFEDRTLGEVLHILQHTTMLWNPNMREKCNCPLSNHNSSKPNETVKHLLRKRDVIPHSDGENTDAECDLITNDNRSGESFKEVKKVMGDGGDMERKNDIFVKHVLNLNKMKGKSGNHNKTRFEHLLNDKQHYEKPTTDHSGANDVISDSIATLCLKDLFHFHTENNSNIKDMILQLYGAVYGFKNDSGEFKQSSDGRRRISDGIKRTSDGRRRISDGIKRTTDGIGRMSDGRKRTSSGIRQTAGEIERQSDKIRRKLSRIKRRPYKIRRSNSGNCSSIPDVFILSVNSDAANYYLVAEFLPLNERNLSHEIRRDIQTFQNEYKKYSKVSTILAYVGFAIFSVMLLEILVKLACLGLQCFRKKIDVFDAFIVIVSFALDAFFLDSRWYESGKGATTVVVLLLPWRIVHIVNGFLMTIKHKHHIEIMTIRRSKKKCETKVSKLKELVVALRRDVDLLVNLCKLKGATGPEITACIYGKERSTATLAAITSFASLMFISTFGTSTPCDVDVSDDLYGNVIQDILDDVDDDEEDDDDDEDNGNDVESGADKRRASILITKDDDDMKDDLENAEIYTVTQSLRRSASRRRTKSKFASQRRATMPRRHVSYSEDDAGGPYVNDGFVTCDETSEQPTGSGKTKNVVKSLPSLIRETSPGNDSFVTFEMRTQVSYL